MILYSILNQIVHNVKNIYEVKGSGVMADDFTPHRYTKLNLKRLYLRCYWCNNENVKNNISKNV